MEYVLGTLIVFNNIARAFGIGAPQLLYIFSGVVLVYFIIKRNSLVKTIFALFTVIAVYAFLVQLITRGPAWMDMLLFLLHALLNITFTIFMVNNFEQMDKDKLILSVAGGQLLLTVIASFLPESVLWQYAEYFTGERASRLKLLYSEASELSAICGIFLLLVAYRLMSRKFSWKVAVSGLIFLVDMLISYGMAGMISFVVSVIIMIMIYIASNRSKVIEDTFMKVKWAAIMVVIFIVMGGIIIISPVYGLRVVDIVKGTDNGLFFTIQQPLTAFVYTMHATSWKGVGFGGLASSPVGAALGYNVGKNSFLNVMINGGALGVVFILLLLFCLLWMCLLYGNVLNISFLIYTFLYQSTSGRFDDPMNWFLYGIILVDCLKTKARLEEEEYP